MSKNVSTRKIGALILLSAPVILLLMILLRSITISAAEANVPIDPEHFPDEAFRAYLSENDSDGDGVLGPKEIEAITGMDLFDRGITSLEGIGYFTDLEKLIVNGNAITELDLSNNTRLLKKLKRCDLVENYVIPGQSGTEEIVDPAVEENPSETTVTEPEVTEPEVTEIEVTEPEVTEPEVTETEVNETEVTQTDVNEPAETKVNKTENADLDAVTEESEATGDFEVLTGTGEESKENTEEETSENTNAPQAAPRTCTAYLDAEGNVVLAVDAGVVITPAIEKSETEIYTVTFMHGDNVLKTVEVEEGEAVEKPALDAFDVDMVFAGWFTDQEFTEEYDFFRTRHRRPYPLRKRTGSRCRKHLLRNGFRSRSQ